MRSWGSRVGGVNHHLAREITFEVFLRIPQGAQSRGRFGDQSWSVWDVASGFILEALKLVLGSFGEVSGLQDREVSPH